MVEIRQLPTTAYIALGSNLGDRESNVREALRRLDALDDVTITKISTFLETDPVGPPGQGRFINAAAQLQTKLSAKTLLFVMLDIERAMGRLRDRDRRWGPRVIDLDLLLFGDDVIDEPGLTVPHPRMHERLFVLDPLKEIAANVVHPVLGKSIKSLRAAMHAGRRSEIATRQE